VGKNAPVFFMKTAQCCRKGREIAASPILSSFKEEGYIMETLFSADNTWALWAIVIALAAISIMLEQRYQWAAKISGAVVALIGGLALANFKVIPTDSGVYDAVWGYVVPVSIPMLLYRADLKKILKESGRMFQAFWFVAVGTCLGAIVATLLLHNAIPQLSEIAGMMTASYIGGGVNFVAMAAVFAPQENLINATIVADNLVMAAFFLIYMYIPTMPFFRKRFRLSYPELDTEATSMDVAENKAASYWARKEVSLKDVAFTIAIAFGIAAFSKLFGDYMNGILPSGNFLFDMIHTILSNQYFLITLITVAMVTIFSKFFSNLSSGQEIGTFLIYIFFVVIGIPASIMEIVTNSPLLFVFCIIVGLANLAFAFIAPKVSKISLEEALLASNATVGGPTTAAAMAISKGWSDHVIPALLCGLTGYVMGNFFGLFIGNSLLSLLG
jgi:uncharacterized membrane protein